MMSSLEAAHAYWAEGVLFASFAMAESEEFMVRQSDPESAAKNFVKFDKDKSGDVNREEYVTSGK